MFFPKSCEAGSSSFSESPQPCRELSFSEIQLATQDFDESLVIGHGGFGKVYKGTITNGESILVVAVKRLDSTSNQGAVEFWAEVKMLSKLRHCHLVSLIGYCNDRQEMILIYEYMPRGTLEDHLHNLQSLLPWVTRLKICIGAARGLDYLHTGAGIHHGVIHRDVKSSNILLHNNWAAKISDFGLSKIGPTNQPSTYVNTLVKGTFGYLDPDYFQTGRLTRKSDVYAYGVVLLEVLCGKRAVDRSLDEERWGLASWALDSIKEGRLKQIVDPNIKERIFPKCLKEFARLAERCLHSHPKQRPTMAEVVVSLESILVLQEKADTALCPPAKTLFGIKMPMFLFPSNQENFAGGISLKPLELYLDSIQGEHKVLNQENFVGGISFKLLDLYLDSIQGEPKVLIQFAFKTISAATENFSAANKMSQHRYGSMYKGKLQNGQGIAVSRPYLDTEFQGYKRELSLLVKSQHENLIQLLGYCIKGTTMFIVYDFAPYASLDRLIFDPMSTLLEWNERCKIIVGVARVLIYLHKHAPIQIIHGNVKPSNILLDVSLDPKLADFWFARCLANNENDSVNVEIILQTSEYTAPEYMDIFHGPVSTKSDVFSFGMLILKTISGCRNYNDIPTANKNFVEYAWTNWWTGTYSSIVDPRIDADSSSIRRFIHIGLLCVQEDASDRPTMEDVLAMLLSSSFLTLPIPNKPVSPQIIEDDLAITNVPVALLLENHDIETVEEFISELHSR